MSQSYCVGIDFGTSYSCISFFNQITKKVDVLTNPEGNFTTPTMIYFSKDTDEILYGEIVQNLLNSSNNNNYLENIITNIKRLIGISYNQLQNDISLKQCFERNCIIDKNNKIYFKILYNNKEEEFSVYDIIKLYLNYLKQIINQNSNTNKIISCCFTVPAYFTDLQREILKTCAEDVNFKVLRILNEPTSAALAYGFGNKSHTYETILVVDCGGGTTDISLLYLDYTDSLYQVKNTAGNNFLGGEDITNVLAKFIKEKLIQNKNFKETMSMKLENKIKRLAEQAKKELSFNNSTKICFEFSTSTIVIEITKRQFEELTIEFFNKIKNLIYYVLDDYLVNQNSNFKFTDINSVIFIGGSTRVPYFKHIFKEHFNINNINTDIDPDQAVSIGASIQCALLLDLIDIQNGGDTLLLDVIPLTIGIETLGGLMSPIISRNSIIPINRTREFINSKAFEDTIIVNIYQGERKFIKDNEYLTSFQLKSDILGKYDRGEILIKVSFNVNQDSIITAKATAKISDNLIESEIEIKKEQIYENTSNLNNILFNAEMNKLIDTELASKTLAKLELYDSFCYLLSVFHEKFEENKNSFLISSLNELFNNTFNIIQNYKNYSIEELEKTKKTFEKKWHQLLFDSGPLFKDSNGLFIELGGTNI